MAWECQPDQVELIAAMAAKPEWFDGAVGGMIQSVQSENRALIEKVQQENRQAFVALGAQVTAVQAVQKTQNADIKDLKNEQAVQKDEIKLLKEAQSGASSSRADENFIPRG